MKLQAKLDALREASKTRLAPEVRAIMDRHIGEMRASGAVDRVVRVGMTAPDFTLPNGSGARVGLADLRDRGPVVLSFYRGRW